MKPLNDITKLFGEDYTNQQIVNLVLRDLNKMLGTEVGILSNIVDDVYTVKAASSVYVPGDVFKLSDTYCCLIQKTKQPLDVTDVENCGLKKHPLYVKRKVETYIACPMFVNGQFYGTFNFSSTIKRKDFTQSEKFLVNSMAKEIQELLPL